MVSLFACEDSIHEALELKMAVYAAAHSRGITVDLHLFNSGEQLLANFTQGEVALVFLDVVMSEGMSGMDVARKIREIDPAVPLVFVTSSTDYALESYDVQALHYLVKPITEESMSAVFNRCDHLFNSARKSINLIVNRNLEHVLVRDIVYAEVLGNRSTVRRMQDTLTTYTPLSSLLEETGTSFLRCHRSFMVNMDHVSRVDGKEFVMITNDRIPIRTNGRAAVVAAYQDYLARDLSQNA